MSNTLGGGGGGGDVALAVLTESESKGPPPGLSIERSRVVDIFNDTKGGWFSESSVERRWVESNIVYSVNPIIEGQAFVNLVCVILQASLALPKGDITPAIEKHQNFGLVLRLRPLIGFDILDLIARLRVEVGTKADGTPNFEHIFEKYKAELPELLKKRALCEVIRGMLGELTVSLTRELQEVSRALFELTNCMSDGYSARTAVEAEGKTQAVQLKVRNIPTPDTTPFYSHSNYEQRVSDIYEKYRVFIVALLNIDFVALGHVSFSASNTKLYEVAYRAQPLFKAYTPGKITEPSRSTMLTIS